MCEIYHDCTHRASDYWWILFPAKHFIYYSLSSRQYVITKTPVKCNCFMIVYTWYALVHWLVLSKMLSVYINTLPWKRLLCCIKIIWYNILTFCSIPFPFICSVLLCYFMYNLLLGGIDQSPVYSPHKGPVMRNSFACHDIIMWWPLVWWTAELIKPRWLSMANPASGFFTYTEALLSLTGMGWRWLHVT